MRKHKRILWKLLKLRCWQDKMVNSLKIKRVTKYWNEREIDCNARDGCFVFFVDRKFLRYNENNQETHAELICKELENNKDWYQRHEIDLEENLLFGHIYNNYYIIDTYCTNLKLNEIIKIIKELPIKNKIWFTYEWRTVNPKKKDLKLLF